MTSVNKKEFFLSFRGSGGMYHGYNGVFKATVFL